jgi:uncharacterized protein
MKFLDRTSELALLNDHAQRAGAGMVVIYGRRRIGKTALLTEFLRNRERAAYHVGTRSTMADELGRLSISLGSAWGVPLLLTQPLSSIDAFLAFLEGMPRSAILVFDEFPFLCESDSSFPGLLQAAWDKHLSKSDLKLFFCGSSVGMMEQTFLSERSPLFGRRTGQLKLGPFPPMVLQHAFPWPLPEVIELYALFGGVPGYLQRLVPAHDLFANLEQRVLTRGEPLYEEVPFLLREELREVRVYHAILATIAGGARKFGEISSKVGLDRANLMRYLTTLMDLGFCEREVPVLEKNPDKSRKGLYRITDPFLATWFTFVHPNRDALERNAIDKALRAELKKRLLEYLPKAVEPALRRFFSEPPFSELVPFPIAFQGRQWSENGEFDIVMLDRERHKAFVAEVKWQSKPISRALLDDLRAKVNRERAFQGCECTYALVSRAGFSGKRQSRKDERYIDISGLDG